MECGVGVHTGQIILAFTEGMYGQLKLRVPAKPGKRQWFIMERDGGVFAERSQVGSTPTHRARYGSAMSYLETHTDTIVRCHRFERPIEFPRAGQFFVPMPPHHEWPWMRDSTSRLKNITMDKWRWHLVQELNARIRSATKHQVDLPSNLPPWVSNMLTPEEWEKVHSNQEI